MEATGKPHLEYLDGSRKKFQKLELYLSNNDIKIGVKNSGCHWAFSMWLHNYRWQEVWCCSSGKQCLMLEKLIQPMRATSSPNMHCVTSVSSMKSGAVWVFIPEKSGPPIFLSFPSRDPVCQHTSTLMEGVKTFVNYDSKRRNNLEDTH